MQQRFCSYGEPTACDGRMNDCPRCGDRVCDYHGQDGLCLACQDDAEEEVEAQEEYFMTRKQWGLLVSALSTAKTLCRSRIEDRTGKGYDASLYEGWLKEAEQASEELQNLAVKAQVFFQPLEEVA